MSHEEKKPRDWSALVDKTIAFLVFAVVCGCVVAMVYAMTGCASTPTTGPSKPPPIEYAK